MALSRKRGRRLPSRLARILTNFKNITNKILKEVWISLKSPLNWASIFWDCYLADEFPDHVMRLLRILFGICYIFKIIDTPFIGLFFVIDGIYSVYRYRVEFKLTKSWREDIPRITRSILGFMLMRRLF